MIVYSSFIISLFNLSLASREIFIFLRKYIFLGFIVISEIKVRLSKKNTLYIPKAIASAAGLREGYFVKLKVEGSRIIIEPILDPFDLALKGSKFAETTFEEFEKESEEMQDELFK